MCELLSYDSTLCKENLNRSIIVEHIDNALMAAILNFEVNMNSKLKSNYFSGFVMTIFVEKDISFVFLAYLVTEIIHFENCSFFSAAILFCIFQGEKQKIRLGNRFFRIQHARIRLESVVPSFYSKMHLKVTFLRNPSHLIWG